MFRDRAEAGVALADVLGSYRNQPVLILGLPRGGVVVAAALALELNAPLDVYIVRKLRAPGNDEFAVGALAEDGEPVLDEASLSALAVPAGYVTREVAARRAEITHLQILYRRGRDRPAIAGVDAILVDDGVATGATVEAAVRGVRESDPASVILAVPVASESALRRLEPWCDAIQALQVPKDFSAVGQFYRNFDQTTDAEVVAALESRPDAK